MIILFGAEKGGVGKSTLSTNLVGMMSKRSMDVLMIDADPQPSSSNWVERRDDDTELNGVTCVRLQGSKIARQILAQSEKYEHIIIDTGGRDSDELRAAMVVADKLFIPLKPSQPDAETLVKMEMNIETAGTFRKNDLIVKVIISMASTNTKVKEFEELIEVLEDFEDIGLVDKIIKERKIYRDAFKIGRTVEEVYPLDKKALSEIEDIFQEVLS